MLLNFDENKAGISFNKEVLPLTDNLNPHYNFYLDKMEAVIILNQNPLFFIFLNYLPLGTLTTLPTYKDSLSNKPGLPRTSKGEWIVDIVFKCHPKDAEKLLTKLKKINYQETPVVQFIKHELSLF